MNGACYLTDGESKKETLLPLSEIGMKHCVCVCSRGQVYSDIIHISFYRVLKTFNSIQFIYYNLRIKSRPYGTYTTLRLL